MCSQRAYAASLRCHRGLMPVLGRAHLPGIHLAIRVVAALTWSLWGVDFSVIEGCRYHLRTAIDLACLRNAGEVHLLMEQIVTPVFAHSFDEHRVLARFHELAGVIFAVPLQCVLARRTR